VAALPLPVRVILALLLMASIGRAFLGAPAPAPRPPLTRVLLGVMALAYLGALAAWAGRDHPAGALLAALGVEAGCLAVWLSRAGPPEPPPEPPAPEEPPPLLDWARFDRERDLWGRAPRRPRPSDRARDRVT
jgi:hypothetical protein